MTNKLGQFAIETDRVGISKEITREISFFLSFFLG